MQVIPLRDQVLLRIEKQANNAGLILLGHAGAENSAEEFKYFVHAAGPDALGMEPGDEVLISRPGLVVPVEQLDDQTVEADQRTVQHTLIEAHYVKAVLR